LVPIKSWPVRGVERASKLNNMPPSDGPRPHRAERNGGPQRRSKTPNPELGSDGPRFRPSINAIFRTAAPQAPSVKQQSLTLEQRQNTNTQHDPWRDLKYAISHALTGTATIVRGMWRTLTDQERMAVASRTDDKLKEHGDRWKLDEEIEVNPLEGAHSSPPSFTRAHTQKESGK
jgi:hypothetical protein